MITSRETFQIFISKNLKNNNKQEFKRNKARKFPKS